ncbi:MAG: helix-turn-helix transcriptional regulator [Anaerolineaceae bacterium]|nr:helix-turn-helix transcriptional regulator [Anaerolineaceae bacterium]
MENDIDLSIATSEQIEQALGKQIEKIRLMSARTQAQLAADSGIATKTIYRLERGEGVSLNTFIRVLQVLGLSDNLTSLLPDPTIRPVERVAARGTERKRARPKHSPDIPPHPWKWGDDK